MSWVWWLNNVRLHSKTGYFPPIEYEIEYDRHDPTQHGPLPGEPALH